MTDPRFIESIKDLKPTEARVQMLPGGHILLNPTEVELRIIALYVEELNRWKPVQGGETTVQGVGPSPVL